MKLCYQVATPDVAAADSVIAYQGLLDQGFGDLVRLGYDGAELMTPNPGEPDWEEVKGIIEKYGTSTALVRTGELSRQLGPSYTSPEEEIRREAIKRTKETIDFAGYPRANINIGRVRGQRCTRFSYEQIEGLAVEAFRELTDYTAPGSAAIAFEAAIIMQTNFISTLAEGACVVERVDRPSFRLMTDVFHLNLEERSLYQVIRNYSKYNIHVHLADNNRRYPGHCGLDFEEILTTFKECSYDGNFCTETFQIPSMKEVTRGAMTCLGPIVEWVYERRAAGRNGI